ncbi:protein DETOXIFICATION 42 isoform X1 [Gossypium raimondii]|uniref:Protein DETOXIFICATION n=1 Tax=Gossypium hirsutum TaxID=3635 RepID=A0A1U8I7G8_GOSHI|nr:protein DETOXIFICATION 42 isoform X1 [Gossypium raimondii]XP_016671679.1 protein DETOXIFICATION 42 isoform X2 [Gossypium hirsutum]XP_052477393.1 protein DETOXIFICATION 42 isoform X1 [Gossypium raimondii]XP_052477394.1 protein DETOXIFICATION 42 isoform X1 [Gossypium raimondii]
MMTEEDDLYPSSVKMRYPIFIFFKDVRHVFKLDELGSEIAQIALPAALALTADPIASLVDTAFIGQIGAVELAAVGVSIALFNQVSRIAIFPLVSVTTSFVAEEDTIGRVSSEAQESDYVETGSCVDTESNELIPQKECIEGTYRPKTLGSSFDVVKIEPERRHIPSASSALVIGGILGLLQALFLISGAKPLLNFMGISSDSPMLNPAQQYLTLRSLGAPAVLLSLAMQGVFRGFKDTKTPLYATVAGDVANIILDPIFMFVFRLGVSGAAIAHVISQYLISVILLWKLMSQVDLLPPSLKHLYFGRFLKNGFLLLIRVMAVTFCITLSASMAARLGSTSMAAFQVCLQVWLATSLLADGLAVAGQVITTGFVWSLTSYTVVAILASSFARKDNEKATATASRVLQLGLVLGLILAVILGGGLSFGAKLFTKDADVLRLIGTGIPFVAATQPINSLAFVFDGVNFGASDFAYSAFSLVLVAIASIICLCILSSTHGFIGLWISLTIYMSLRAFAGFWRIGTGTGPWKFLRG